MTAVSEQVVEGLRTRGGARASTFTLSALVWGLLALALVVLVLYPLLSVLYESFRNEAGWTLNNYLRSFNVGRFQRSIMNSVILATTVGVLSVLISAPMAWAIARTNLPGRRLFLTLAYASLATPGFLLALGWSLLGGPNAGLLNHLWRAVTGSPAPLVNIFTFPGLVFTSLVECYPFAFILIYSGLQLVSSEMEDAANILGAGTLRTACKVTLPLVLPAIIAGFILSFTQAIVLFGGPFMIGVPAGVYVLTTQIYSLFQWPPQIGMGAALAMPLLLTTAALLILQRRLLGRRSYAVVTGKTGSFRTIELGRLKWPLLTLCCVVIVGSVVLPLFTLGNLSVMKAWGAGISLENLTLERYKFVLFDFEVGRRAFLNSLLLALAAATSGSLFGAAIAYVVHRKLVRGTVLLGFLAMVPIAVPGTVLAVGLFASYSKPPLLLYGTLWILYLAYLTHFLPYSFMNSGAAIQGIHEDLEGAARICGASHLKTFRVVMLPLIKHGLLAGWFLIFIYSFRELSSSIFLFTHNSIVLSITIMDLYEQAHLEPLTALAVVTILFNLGIVLLGYRLIGRNFLGGGSGQHAA